MALRPLQQVLSFWPALLTQRGCLQSALVNDIKPTPQPKPFASPCLKGLPLRKTSAAWPSAPVAARLGSFLVLVGSSPLRRHADPDALPVARLGASELTPLLSAKVVGTLAIGPCGLLDLGRAAHMPG